MQRVILKRSVRSALAALLGIGLYNTALAEIEIKHKAVKKARSGERISIDAAVSEDDESKNGIKTVRTYFKADDSPVWQFVSMNNGDGSYSGLLPAADIATESVDYQLLVVNGAKEIQKTDIFSIRIRKDEDALARMQEKPPRDVKVDLDQVEKADELAGDVKKERVSQSDRENQTDTNTNPGSQTRVAVGSEYAPNVDLANVAGFDDYINLQYTGSAASYGVPAGIVDAAKSIAGTSAGTAGTYTGVAAVGGGVGGGAVLGGILVAGAAAGGGGGGGGNSSSSSASAPTSSSSSAPATPSVASFAGSWRGANCPSGPPKYVVSLSQSGASVSGTISFHACPGGGRVTYNVSGTATSASTVSLAGGKSGGQGPLGGSAPGSVTFSIRFGAAPSPNFAP